MADGQQLVAKVVLLGDAGVGKSSLLARYTKGEFGLRYVATIGADFTTKDINIDKKRITLQLWDTAGQERFQSLGTAFYRGADCCILTFDVNVPATFTNLARWRQEFLIQASPNDPDQFPFIVIGNKIDKAEQRAVSKKEAMAWCESLNMDFFETSAKDGSGVEKAFEVAAHHAVSHHMLDINMIRGGIDDKIQLSDFEKKSGVCGCMS